MAIHINTKNDYETFNGLQVRAVNKCGMYCIVIGAMKELTTGDVKFAEKGEIYLYQEWDEDETHEKKMRELHSQTVAAMTAAGEKDIPTYEELSEFDDLFPLKIEYHLGKGKFSDNAILIDKVIVLPLEDQLTYDDDGNIVKASLFD